MTDYDVIIAGAGMSGSMLALAILTFSPELRVVLIDENEAISAKRGAGEHHSGFDARSIALSAGSCKLLNEMGVWQQIKAFSQAIDEIKISDEGNLGGLTLTPEATPYGVVAQLKDIGAILEAQLNKFNSTQLSRYSKATITSIKKTPNSIQCLLPNGQTIRGKLCVAADGGNSQTRDLLSIKSHCDDYYCTAIIANLKMKDAHNNVAFEHFTASGPFALLPLQNQCYSLVWSVSNSDVEKLMSLDESTFLREIQIKFGFKAGAFEKVGRRDCYPLKLLTVDHPMTHRGVCIGNAAHSLHPVMGQGFNLGLRDLYVLAKVISELEDKSSLGDFTMLNDYWQCREKDHLTTINMTDSIVRVFANPSPLFKIGRTLGFTSMSCASYLSRSIVKQAKGNVDLFPIKKGMH